MAVADIQITLLIGRAIDQLRLTGETDFLPRFATGLLVLAVAQGLFRFLQRWLIVGVSRRFERDLKQELFDRLVRLSFRFHDKSRSGDVVTRLTSDVENLRMVLGPGTLMYVLSAMVIVPGSLYVLTKMAPLLTLCMVIPLFGVTFTMKYFARRLHRLSTNVQERQSDLGHRAQESFGGVRVIKAYGIADRESEQFTELSRRSADAAVDYSKASGMTQALVGLAHNLAFLPILFVGGAAMIDSTLAAGDLFKFVDLANKSFWPVIALGWMAGLVPRAMASADRVQALLDETSEIEEPTDPVSLPRVRGALTLERVSFRYPGAARLALDDVSIAVAPGETLGIVGPTGSGKSTLLSLVGRLYEGEGTIRLDGVPLAELSFATLRGALAFVPQDGFLFSDSYRANLSLGASAPLGDEHLWRLVKEAGLEREVRSFPLGLEQPIGERGVTLSGGQRQRTCIARALAADPVILVLDDALSAVDTETEAKLIGNLERAGRGRTVLVAAHRLGTVKGADKIIVLNDGRIDAVGTHAELLESSNWYRRTWKHQSMQAELEKELGRR